MARKAIFLEQGQYIKFLADDFLVRKIEFSNESKFYDSEVRVLFKHLVSLGYNNLMECEECLAFLSESVFNEPSASIIDVSSKQWYWQNPFKVNKEENQIIFDAKDIIDKEYSNHLTSADLTDLINERGYNSQALIKDKVGLSITKLVNAKRLQEKEKKRLHLPKRTFKKFHTIWAIKTMPTLIGSLRIQPDKHLSSLEKISIIKTVIYLPKISWSFFRYITPKKSLLDFMLIK